MANGWPGVFQALHPKSDLLNAGVRDPLPAEVRGLAKGHLSVGNDEERAAQVQLFALSAHIYSIHPMRGPSSPNLASLTIRPPPFLVATLSKFYNLQCNKL